MNKNGQYQLGQSGNPNGRPKKDYSITETIRNMMGIDPLLKKKLAKTVIDLAIKGDLAAIRLIWNYMDGQPLQPTDVTSNGEGLTVVIDSSLAHYTAS